jgi:hypothetical protein
VESPPLPAAGERPGTGGSARRGPLVVSVPASAGDAAGTPRRPRAPLREKLDREAGGNRTQTATGRRGEEPQARG